MEGTKATSPHAALASKLVEGLQERFRMKLEALSEAQGHKQSFERVEWLRDEGRHGGGHRYVTVETPVFNRAAINVSAVHYDDMPEKKLGSATAISTIIHPTNPRAPSVHMHISWTEMRDGSGYWRMMADLNPSIVDDNDKFSFLKMLKDAAPAQFAEANAQGDRYFHVPMLNRHRGVAHFYLEGYRSGDDKADAQLAQRLGENVIDRYVELLAASLARSPGVSDEDVQAQLAYHSAYLLQVLTLDRGTTSGLLVHDQNDVGIMGSLPAFVDRALLTSWVEKMPPPQDALLTNIVDALTDEAPSHVTQDVRIRLASVVRRHYQEHPEALQMQAAGNTVPPTVANHKATS